MSKLILITKVNPTFNFKLEYQICVKVEIQPTYNSKGCAIANAQLLRMNKIPDIVPQISH